MLMSPRHLLLALALLLVVGTPLGVGLAHAQPTGSPSGGRQQLATARTNLSYAQANVDRLKDRAERSLAHDKNWASAKAAVDEAQKNRETVRAQVKEQTMATAEYQALQHHMEAATSDSQRAEARAKMATMVWEAQLNSSECAAAQEQLHQVQADLDARWKDYENRVLSRDPEWTKAIAARDAARAQVSAALQAQHARNAGRQSGVSRSGGSGYGRSNASGSRGSRSSGGSRSYYR